MNKTNDTFTLVNDPEYDKHFWNYLLGREGHKQFLDSGKKGTGGYALPTVSEGKFDKKLKAESKFRQLATCVYAPYGPSTIHAKMNSDSATWVKENEEIPIYDAIDDFSFYSVNDHKLAVLMQLDSSFLHDNRYTFESYLTDRLVRDFSRAEEYGFLQGTGEDMPVGILAENGGADIGITANTLTFDDVIKLFFSVKPEYRNKGTWLMSDETALVLRTLKDNDGNYLWKKSDDTILGKKVIISEFMTDEKPIAFGDFSYYWIVDRNPLTVQVLRERFFETDQIGYLAIEKLDGKLIRNEAIKVLQITE